MNGCTVFLVYLLCITGCLYVADGAPSLHNVIESRDQDRLRGLFDSAPVSDLETAYYVTRGLKLLRHDNPNVFKKACSIAKGTSPTAPVDHYYATSIVALIGKESCQGSFNKKELISLLTSGERNLTEIFWLASSLANIGADIPKTVTVGELVNLIDQYGTVMSTGHGFSVGSLLAGDETLTPLMELIEDLVAQADESGGRLYFEDLASTSSAITGIFSLAAAAKTPPTLSTIQAIMFGNYFVSLKYTSNLQEIVYMLQAADALANNQFVVPVGLVRTDSRPVTSSDSSVEFKLTNILNEGVGSSSVTMVMIQDPSGETTNTNVPLNANGDIYTLSLANNVGTPGNYKLTLSTDTQGNSQAADLSGVQFGVVVTQTVNIGSADLFIIEKEQNVAVKSLSLQYPNPVTEVLTADHHSKVKMTFTLTGSSTKATSAHQAFVRLSSEDGEEIFFVAMPTSQGEYVFELDVAKAAKESFGYKSGAYSMSLIVGGALVDNPFVWDVCKLTLKFPAGQQESVDEEKLYRNKPRPVIEHMFRLPEKLPPFTVSAAFSVIIVFFLVVLLIMWLIMGANVTNLFSSGPWALVFHCGLISIFLLYYCFWIKMNMFQTLKWLALLGGITFLAGNKMLKNISKNK